MRSKLLCRSALGRTPRSRKCSFNKVRCLTNGDQNSKDHAFWLKYFFVRRTSTVLATCSDRIRADSGMAIACDTNIACLRFIRTHFFDFPPHHRNRNHSRWVPDSPYHSFFCCSLNTELNTKEFNAYVRHMAQFKFMVDRAEENAKSSKAQMGRFDFGSPDPCIDCSNLPPLLFHAVVRHFV